jgi:nicotinamide-nucleotide amidase
MSVARLITLARAANATIATAESCTGGMVAAAITAVPGASDVFDHSCVTYSNAAKVRMLDVMPVSIAQHGAVSAEVAREMAEGALKSGKATLAVAITGVAGPGGTDQKPEGLVWFATAMAGAETQAEMQEFGAIGRASVRDAATDHAIELLVRRLG